MLYESNNYIFSTVDVLVVILPILLGIAFMTIIERKQLAAHQRRVGPNTTGQKFKIYSFKRSYHSSSYPIVGGINNNTELRNLYDKAIETLYKNRKAPVKPFKENVRSVCKDLLSSTALSTFFKDLKGKGGIYVYFKKWS